MTRDAHPGAALDQALHVLSACAPEETGRARKGLEVLLRGVRTSRWPEVAWAFSGLTPDGFPVELTFSSLASHGVRYAAELAGPEMPESERIREAFRLYQVLAGRPASVEVERALVEMQSAGELFYGAWFGGAHSLSGDRYKIYAEVPDGASLGNVVRDLFDDGLPLPHCQPAPHMFSFQPDSGVREVYFRASCLGAADLGRLLWNWSLGHRYREALELIEITCGRAGLPPAIAAFSVASDRDRNLRAVSLFAPATILFGSDANIRRTLLGLGKRRNWDLSLYERASEPLKDRDDHPARHGIIAWIVSQQGPIELRVGLRPPEPADHSV